MKTTAKHQSTQTRTSRKKYVAFHEAGHAMIADWFAVDFTVTIDGASHIAFESPRSGEITSLIAYGGPLAQARYQKQGLLFILITCGIADMELIEEQAEAWAHVGLKESKRSQWKEAAQSCLKKRWDLVEAIADQLMQRGTLTSRDLRQIAVSLGHEDQDRLFPYD